MTTDKAELEEFDERADPPNWGEEKFVDLMESMRNGLYKKKDFYGEGNQIVKMGELFASEFITNQEGMDRLELTDKELKKHGLARGDLLFARRSYVREGSGKCSIVSDLEEPLVPESSIIRARPNENLVVPEFVYYYFKSEIGRNEILKIVRQTAVSGIAQSDLKEVNVPIPPKKSQEVIVEYLKSLDDKIRVNSRINQLLEEIAKELFRYRFVDFEPYQEFKETSNGEIPEGFDVSGLTDIAEIVLGGTPDSDEEAYWGGDIVWAKAKDVSNEPEAFISSTEKNITKKGLEESSTEIAPKHSTVITARGTVGELAMPSFDMAINQSCYSLVSLREEDRYFVYFLMDAILNNLMSRTHGTVFDTITKRTLNEQDVILPSESERDKFYVKVKPLMEKIQENQRENQTLERIRDTLLPKLMSGEVRVNDINVEDLEVITEV